MLLVAATQATAALPGSDALPPPRSIARSIVLGGHMNKTVMGDWGAAQEATPKEPHAKGARMQAHTHTTAHRRARKASTTNSPAGSFAFASVRSFAQATDQGMPPQHTPHTHDDTWHHTHAVDGSGTCEGWVQPKGALGCWQGQSHTEEHPLDGQGRK